MPSKTPGITCCEIRRGTGSTSPSQRAANLVPLSSSPLLERADQRLLRDTVEMLRERVQVAYPVVIRTSRVPAGLDGFCTLRRTHFVIHLADDLLPEFSPYLAVHGFAHAAAWNYSHDRACHEFARGRITLRQFEEAVHDAAFGVEYAKCWSVYSGSVLPEFARRRELPVAETTSETVLRMCRNV